MARGARQWTRELMRRLQRHDPNGRSTLPQNNDSDPALPYLPGSSASRVSLTDGAAEPENATASPFFTRLPPEIRHQILVEAFGGRTLHMDIRESPPLLPISERSPNPSSVSPNGMPHGGLGADLERYGMWSTDVMKAAAEARVISPDGGGASPWQWWSCVCHRNLPKEHNAPPQPLGEDGCLRGKNTMCFLYAGQTPGKCLIGASGWLRTCRQAYAEGIQVLYGSNSIVLSRAKLIDALLASTDRLPSSPSIQHVAAVVPTAHLDRILRLEIAWDWCLFARPVHSDEQTAARARVVDLLESLAHVGAFPRLVSLVLAFGDSLYQRSQPPDQHLDDVDTALLMPLGDLATRRNNRLLQLTVELPTNTFEPLYSRAVRTGSVYEGGAAYGQRRFWWPPPTVSGERGDDETDRVDIGCGFWVKSGIQSSLCFDYQGKPYRLGAIATCF
ncbi:hypothetical protein SPBR_02798 [Sporothrix brasiliensis 5110]|uniref:Uncharacterized protein n=1 Tax=Sporothrix brasiliensis 5110 TaxID=1398154 RepID=A0A0C2J5Y5_9PEZI|nr:uncharacterized protein SPBR_02798 [Sporothrix brasiliensis 5110]KIH92457.1 hypothetical protein SPBR_02798 [Sporothrix brasiliensis 5110]